MTQRTDAERVALLEDVDNGDFDVSEWEADFLESMLRLRGRGPAVRLTPGQRKAADGMIEKYLE